MYSIMYDFRYSCGALYCKWEMMLLKAQLTDVESQICELERDFYPLLLQGQEEDGRSGIEHQ